MKKRSLSLILCTVILVSSLLGCTYEKTEPAPLTDFRQIQGITTQDIKDVEKALEGITTLKWGAVTSPEAFIAYNRTTIAGFVPMFCKQLEDLFDIKIQIVTGKFKGIMEMMKNGKIDLSADFSRYNIGSENFYMTSDITQRELNIYSLLGQEKLKKESGVRTLNYLLVTDSNAASIVKEDLITKGNIRMVSGTSQAIPLLISGEADALILDDSSSMRFADYPEVKIETYDPLTFYPMVVASGKSELEPIIRVLQKYIDSSDSQYISKLYEQGAIEYRKDQFRQMLTTEEKIYIDSVILSGEAISVNFQDSNYPIAFYNTHTENYEGITIDILDEITKLTGLPFEIVAEKDATANPEHTLLLNSTHNRLYNKNHLFVHEPYVSYNYCFISRTDYRDMEYSDIRLEKIGVVNGTIFKEAYETWFPNYDYILFETREKAFEALENQAIDVLLMSQYSFLYATHYLEMSDLKINILLNTLQEHQFAFEPEASILHSIIGKAQHLTDTEKISTAWENKVFDYKGKMLEQSLLVFSVTLALVVALVILLVITLNKNHKLAVKDELTRLPNRRWFIGHSKRSIEIQAVQNNWIAVWFADIDNFKCINDNYGHDFGDEVLTACANTFVRCSRDTEIPCRYGGEEFAALLTNISPKGAEQMASRLVKAISDMKFSAYPDLTITISMGVYCQIADRETRLDDMLARADEAMYLAKKAGKNRYIIMTSDDIDK